MGERQRVIVIGAGIGGLTAGALLLHAGYEVTVLEGQIYPGGSASTFFRKGYHFDAGATLAGGFSPGGPHARVADILKLAWPVKSVDPAWVVHLSDGRTVTQWSDPERWQSEWQAAFPESGPFWRQQQMLADVSWDIAARPFPWPPSSTSDLLALAQAVRPPTLRVLPYMNTKISDMIVRQGPARQGSARQDPAFKAFLDGQLLISAQTTSERANALYGSAALDLPRRGVKYVWGGIGSLATILVEWIRAHGGHVHFRQQVDQIDVEGDHAVGVRTTKKRVFAGDVILANVTPWALAGLLGDATPKRLQREVARREPTWGAFTLYLGLDKSRLPAYAAGHHQVILDNAKPLGEGNSVFISLADPRDVARAPAGKIPATLSTHTAIEPWWRLYREGISAYLERRERYQARLLQAAEAALPGISGAVELAMPGTPVTFQSFTSRPMGMVGGFPQTSLFAARGPRTGIGNLWLVGDSVFPGQSTAGVTLGALRVAADVLQAHVSRSVLRTVVSPPLAAGD